MDHFGYDETDFIPCEITGKIANDIHHIDARGMGGDPNETKNRIEELQAITREMHIELGDKKEYMKFLYQKHYYFLDSHGVKFDRKYLKSRIDAY